MIVSELARHIEKLRELLTTHDIDAIGQGIELAASLGNPEIYENLLSGVWGGDRDGHVFFGIGCGGTFSATNSNERAWHSYSALRLLAESNLDLRHQVKRVGIGVDHPNHAVGLLPTELPLEWLPKLPNIERMNIGLHDELELDLSPLQRLPRLAAIHVSGQGSRPLKIPALQQVRAIYGARARIRLDGRFDKLVALTGDLDGEELEQVDHPELKKLTISGSVKLNQFERLGSVELTGGPVSLPGCRYIAILRPLITKLDAPDLQELGTLYGGCAGLNPEQLADVGSVDLSNATALPNLRFPDETNLRGTRANFVGPSLTKLDHPQWIRTLEWIALDNVDESESLDGLREASSLRVLDLRKSPKTIDLAPLIGLTELRAISIADLTKINVPRELWHLAVEADSDELEELAAQSPPRLGSVECAPHLWKQLQRSLASPSLPEALRGVDTARNLGFDVIGSILALVEIRNGWPFFPKKFRSPCGFTLGPVLGQLIEGAGESDHAERFRALDTLRLRAERADHEDLDLNFLDQFAELNTLTITKARSVQITSIPQSLRNLAIESSSAVTVAEDTDLSNLKSIALFKGATAALSCFERSNVEHLQLSGPCEVDLNSLASMPRLRTVMLTKRCVAENSRVVRQLSITHLTVDPSFDLRHLVGHRTLRTIGLVGNWPDGSIPKDLPVEPTQISPGPLIPFD